MSRPTTIRDILQRADLPGGTPISYEALKRRNDKEAAELQERQRHDHLQYRADRMMQESDVDLINKTFGNYVTNHVWQRNLCETASHFVRSKDKLNLIMCGQYGCGKTHLGAAVLNHLRDHENKVVLAKQWAVLLRELWNRTQIRTINGELETQATKTRRLVTTVDALLIDELGASENDLTDSMLQEVGELIRIRVNRKLMTVITTNFHEADLKHMLGGYVAGGLKEGGLIIHDVHDAAEKDMRIPPQVIFD